MLPQAPFKKQCENLMSQLDKLRLHNLFQAHQHKPADSNKSVSTGNYIVGTMMSIHSWHSKVPDQWAGLQLQQSPDPVREGCHPCQRHPPSGPCLIQTLLPQQQAAWGLPYHSGGCRGGLQSWTPQMQPGQPHPGLLVPVQRCTWTLQPDHQIVHQSPGQ